MDSPQHQEPSGKVQSTSTYLATSSSSRIPLSPKLLLTLALFSTLTTFTHATPTPPGSAGIGLTERQLKSPNIVSVLERRSNSVDIARRTPGRRLRHLPPQGPAAPGPAAPGPPLAGLPVVIPAMVDLQVISQFPIKLSAAPTADVTVYIEADTMMFDKCQVIFTAANWNQPQIVHITQVPFFNPGDARIDFLGKWKTSSKDPKFHCKEAQFKVQRRKQAGGTCVSINDPHMTTFDGFKYDMHGIGPTYYLVQSAFLTVQLRTAPCGINVACNAAVAVRYGKALYIRVAATMTVASPPANNANVRVLAAHGGGHLLQLSDGSNIRIGFGNAIHIHDIQIDLAGHARGQVRGLCGNFNGNPGDDNFGGDNRPHPPNIFDRGIPLGNSWIVPDHDNLFTQTVNAANYKNAVVFQQTAVCKIPPILQGTGEVPPVPTGTLIINKINVFNVKLLPPQPKQPPPVKQPPKEDPKVKELAIKLCKTVFIDAEANKIVEPKGYIDNCLKDAEATNSLAFIEIMKNAYLTVVRTKIAVPKAIPDPKQQKIAIDITIKDGLGDAKCPNDCNKNGECTPNGCLCKLGFTGKLCDQKIPLELTIVTNGEKKPPPIEGPVVKIDVTKIDIKDTDVGQKFTVVLTSEPKDKVEIFMELPGFSFSKCSVALDKTNWDKPQTVTINQMPYFNTKGGVRNLKLNLRTGSFQDPRFHDKKIEIPVTRQGGIGSTCSVLNHPHITTFDRLQMDVMDSGIFSLVESPILSVQIMAQLINEKTAVTRSLAFRYGKTVFIFDGKLGLRKASAGSEGVEVTATKSHTEARFQLGDGTLIKAQRTDETISVEIEAASHYRTKTLGLCGNFDDDKENDMTTPDKKVLKPGPKKILWPDGGEFAKTWVVTPKNNLFECGATCPEYEKAEMQINTLDCAIPLTLEGNGLVKRVQTVYTIVSSVERYVVQIPPPEKLKVVIKMPELKPDFETESKKICTTIFVNPEANKLVDPKPFVDACLADARATGTFTFLDEIKVNYFNKVRMSTRTMVIDPNSDTKIAINIEIKLGLGNANCPQDCSGRGECRSSGCKCMDGFTGLGCEVKIVTIVKIIQLPPPTIKLKIVIGSINIEQKLKAGDGAEKPPSTPAEQAALEGKPLPKPNDPDPPQVKPPADVVFPDAKGGGDKGENPPKGDGDKGGENPPKGGGDKGENPPKGGGDKGENPPKGDGDKGGENPPKGGGDKGENPPKGGGDKGENPPKGGGDKGENPPKGDGDKGDAPPPNEGAY